MRRPPIEVPVTNATAEMIAGDRVILRFESHEGNVSAVMPAKMLHRLYGEIGVLLEPKRVERGWGTRLHSEKATMPPPAREVVHADEGGPEEFDSAGLGRASK